MAATFTHTRAHTGGNVHSQIIMFPYSTTRHFHFPVALCETSTDNLRYQHTLHHKPEDFVSHEIACTKCQHFCRVHTCNTASDSAKRRVEHGVRCFTRSRHTIQSVSFNSLFADHLISHLMTLIRALHTKHAGGDTHTHEQ